MLKDVWLAGGVRTPIGRFLGALSSVPAPRLGAVAARAALDRTQLSAADVDEVIIGNVLGAGLGQNVARQVGLTAGVRCSIGATTINKVCGSGLQAVILAAQAIQCGDARAVLAGGTENMSAAPYLLPRARGGYRLGNGVLVDSAIHDGLWDIFANEHMGAGGDRCAERLGIPRREIDDYAVESYQRAITAQRNGAFHEELTPVDSLEKGEVLSDDEGLSRFEEAKLRKLKPAFSPTGTVTAGNASSLNDGAAAVVVLDADVARHRGIAPQARILGYAASAREPEWFTLASTDVLRQLMGALHLGVADVDLFEINEAFSVVPLAAMRELKIPREKVNIHGGAVALGHPIGASGTRIVVTLLAALARTGGTIGLASICIGGGEALALAIERI